jgi:HEAT repeat protein
LLRYQLVEPLKGKRLTAMPKHEVTAEGGKAASFKQIKAGQTALFFTDCFDKRSLTFLDGLWYWTKPADDGWERGQVRADFLMVYMGSAADLSAAVKKLLRGQEVVVRCQNRATKEDQFACYSLREPHRRRLVPDPDAASIKDRPLSAWLKDLADKRPPVRLQAVQALYELGPAAKEAVGLLAKALRDDNEEVRCGAADALGAIGPAAQTATGDLAKALTDSDWFVCVAAAQALGRIGPPAKSALPALSKALNPTDNLRDYRPIRSAAVAQALVKIDPQGKGVKAAITLLVDKLLSDDREDSNGTRVVGARALGECGTAARPAVGPLNRRLKDANAEVRIAAALALARIEPEKQASTAVAALMGELKGPDVLQRVLAADALGEIGPGARDATAALRKAADDPEAEVRQAATDALKRVGPPK